MIFKKTLSFAASTIKFIIIIILLSKSQAVGNTNKSYSKDKGIVSIMYHRFNENKYPSTNIQMEVFKKHIKIIEIPVTTPLKIPPVIYANEISSPLKGVTNISSKKFKNLACIILDDEF